MQLSAGTIYVNNCKQGGYNLDYSKHIQAHTAQTAQEVEVIQ